MIVFQAKHGGIWRRASATIHCAQFNCMVITRRVGLISRHWQMALFTQSEHRKPVQFGAVSFLPNLPDERVLAIHGDIADYINRLGEQGATLHQAFDTVTLHLSIQRFIDKRILIYEEGEEVSSAEE